MVEYFRKGAAFRKSAGRVYSGGPDFGKGADLTYKIDDFTK